MIWAVFDTNVLVSGLGWAGSVPAQLVDQALAGRFLLVTSPPLLAELGRVLRYPRLAKYFPDPDTIVGLLEDVAVVVAPSSALSVVADDADNRVLEAALEARADVIVTGDRGLLRLGSKYDGVDLQRPREFNRWLSAR